MSDFERLYLVIMIISLVLAAIQIGRDGKDKKLKQAAIQRELVGGFPTLRGESLSKSVIPSCRHYSIVAGGCQPPFFLFS